MFGGIMDTLPEDLRDDFMTHFNRGFLPVDASFEIRKNEPGDIS